MEISSKSNASSYISYHKPGDLLQYFASAIQQARDLDQLFSILETMETNISLRIRKRLKTQLRELIEEKLRKFGYYDDAKDLLVRPGEFKPRKL